MTKHEEFIKERQYLKNVSPKTSECTSRALLWVKNDPSQGD